ncbi:unnamed protein product, partial [marine sediment metagenome]
KKNPVCLSTGKVKKELDMTSITPNLKFVKRKIQEAGKNKPPVCQKAVNEQEVIESYKKMKAMNIIIPNSEFVKRKITEVKKINPVCQKTINRQGLFRARKKSMVIINPDKEFVKRKITETGEKPCCPCVDDFHKQQPRGDFSVSVDIDLKSDHKNYHISYIS